MTTETVWASNIIFEVSSAAPDADPVWVDFSDRVIVPDGYTTETWLGRATELDSPEPGHFQIKLRNRDRALTPGNPTSPYYPWWKQARRCRFREQYGYVAYDLFDGFIEIPENVIDMDVVGDTEADIELNASGTDLLGRYVNGRRFVSTLAEHITYSGTPTAYWPLVGSISTVPATSGQAALTVTERRTSGLTPTAPATATAGAGIPVTGDDLGTYRLAPNIVSSVHAACKYLTGPVTPIAMSNSTLTMAFWVYWEDVAQTPEFHMYESSSTDYMRLTNFTGWAFEAGAGVTSASVSVPTLPSYKWTLLALRMTLPSGLVEFWMDDNDPVTATLGGGVVPSSTSMKDFILGNTLQGNLAHLQVYVGGFTRTQFLAQYQMGLVGLEGQTTGQRVNTVLDYAGFPAYRRDIDPGSSTMTRATLAGNTAATELERARATEQGRLFMVGGRAQFHGRRRLYDI